LPPLWAGIYSFEKIFLIFAIKMKKRFNQQSREEEKNEN